MSRQLNTPLYKSLWFAVLLIALLLIISTMITGYIFINHYESERDKETNNAIRHILEENAIDHKHLPDVVVLNISDTCNKNQLNDSIKTYLKDYLTNRYLNRDETNKNNISLTPYISFLKDSKSAVITNEQIDELKSYIEFLVKTCDATIQESERNIDTEMNKINTWVTIWIGIFGLLGIFIPILINIKSFDNLKEIGIKADEAQNTIRRTLPIIQDHSKSALNDSKMALNQVEKNAKLIHISMVISTLNSLQKVYNQNPKNPINVYHNNLKSVVRYIKSYTPQKEDEYFFELLAQVRDMLYQLLSSTLVIQRHHQEAIKVFVLYLQDLLSSEAVFSKQEYTELIVKFEAFLDSIKPGEVDN